jgi:hypothetical protein
MAEKPESARVVGQNLQWVFFMALAASAVLSWAMWGWGVSAIEQNNANAVAEEIWLSSFSSEHQREWNSDCQGILFSLDAQGVIYNPDTGKAYTVDWCQAQWAPPATPSEYSTDSDAQPERTPPFANWALFGADGRDTYRCIDPALQECYDYFDELVAPSRPR